MNNPVFWIVAGPNGAGKTTLVQKGPLCSLLEGVEFLNPDDVTLQLLQQRGYSHWSEVPVDELRKAFIEGADEVMQRVMSVLRDGRSVGVETVLSTDKYRPVVESLPEIHGKLGLVYVALSSPDISRTRIHRRVSRGGHDVPAEKLAVRWSRSLQKLPWYLKTSSEFWIFDNSSEDRQVIPPLLAYGLLGELVECNTAELFPELSNALANVPRSSLLS